MFVRYGNYTHADNEVALVIQKQAEHSSNGVLTGIRERWNLQGRLQANGSAALTLLINALEVAYANDGGDLTLLSSVSPDVLTSHGITSSATNSGTLVTTRPSFPTSAGAEYATVRNYNIVVEAVTPGPADLLSWTETINHRGTGGPIWGYLNSINAAPLPQTLAQYSPITITQRGEAVGLGAYPSATLFAPVVPQQEHLERRVITYHHPADNSKRRRVSWSYVMEVIGGDLPKPELPA